MNSFISNFKAILIAIGIIVAIELSCWLFGTSTPFNNISLLQYAYLRTENTTNLALLNKMQSAFELPAQFLQVGDSSGMHGLNPKIIEESLPNVTYYNANLGADFGYLGHYNIAKTILARDNHVKYLVLYVTPMAWPAYVHDKKRILEKNVYSAFLSPWHHLTLPSLTFRDQLTNLVYYRTAKTTYTSPIIFNTNDVKKYFNETKGFVPRELVINKTQILPEGACVFSEWFETSNEGKKPIEFFYLGLKNMAMLAREKNLKLILIFNPVTCERRAEIGTLTVERELAKFRHDFPEVIVPFPFITTWPKDRFMDSWHLYSSAATIMSKRVGEELRKILTDPSYRGVKQQSISELNQRIEYVRHHPLRPNSCNESISTTSNIRNHSNHFTNCLGLSFVTIQPHPYFFGSCKKKKSCPKGMQPDPLASTDEYPAHLVKLKKQFQLSQKPVTIQQYNTFLRYYDGDSMTVHTANLKVDPDFLAANKGNPHRPVTMVNWHDAVAYVTWLNKIKPESDKGVYRLPTEAEWEYAARGGTQTAYWWGNEMKYNMANCLNCTDKNIKKPLVSGHYPPNAYGLYDMNGNVWEWAQDCYRNWYSKKNTDGHAYETQNCKLRVLRGGSVEYPANMARAAARFTYEAAGRSQSIGFRVVREESL